MMIMGVRVKYYILAAAILYEDILNGGYYVTGIIWYNLILGVCYMVHPNSKVQ